MFAAWRKTKVNDMGYFPFFVELSGKEGLIVGGGVVALRKIEKLLTFGPKLTVVAPKFHPELEEMPDLQLIHGTFSPEMLQGKTFVIAATDDSALNREIASLCAKQGKLVNVVDDLETCSFLFPALVKQGDLTIGITTGGTSPSAAVWVKNRIRDLLPESFEEILRYMGAVRPKVREEVPEMMRAKAFAALFAVCMDNGRPCTEEEFKRILEEVV